MDKDSYLGRGAGYFSAEPIEEGPREHAKKVKVFGLTGLGHGVTIEVRERDNGRTQLSLTRLIESIKPFR